MKNFLLILVLAFSFSSTFAQVKPAVKDSTSRKEIINSLNNKKSSEETRPPGSRKVPVDFKELIEADSEFTTDFGWSKRISFIAGAGTSFVATEIYKDPVIDQTNNIVNIEKAPITKPNISLGIVYTPFISDIVRTVIVREDKKLKKFTIVEHYPWGFSTALFMNPISLSNISNTGLSNTIDLGMGIGFRSDQFLVLGTVEFFSLRQPTERFINKYKNNDLPYMVGGQAQTSLDRADPSIFYNRVLTAFGIKIAYTFDIVRSFHTTSVSETRN